MNPLYRKPLILFFASFLLILGGMAFKVYKLQASGIVFGAGMLVQMFSVLWLIVLVVKPKK